MACVYIPVQNSEEEVRVALDQLPRDASDILDILKAEQAPLDLWLIIAVRPFFFKFLEKLSCLTFKFLTINVSYDGVFRVISFFSSFSPEGDFNCLQKFVEI